MMMRVAQLTHQRIFRIVEEALPDPAPGEVQVRVGAVGLCGSDLHSFAEGAVGDTPCVYPMVLGHEPAGEVVKCGPGVSEWDPGARAAFEPAIYCYHCEFCMSGRHNVCANMRFMSLPGEPGFFRDYANIPARNLLAIPKGMSFLEATLVEPLAVVLHSMKFVALKPGETALVLGAGPIGWLTVAVLKLAGAGRVWVVEPVAHRRELARAAGADVVLDPAAVDPIRQVLADTGQRGVDVAVDCAAKNGSINQAIHAVRSAGRVVVTGIPSEVQVPVDFHPLRRKELAIFQVRRSNHDSEQALATLTADIRRFAPLLTHSRPLDEVGAAFEQLERYENGVGKIAIAL
jgi:L-iditol 2-dehydrogenase